VSTGTARRVSDHSTAGNCFKVGGGPVAAKLARSTPMEMLGLIGKLAAVAMVAVPVHAGEVTTRRPAKTPCDELWSHAILYKSADNPVLQEFALQGRLHLQYAAGSSDQGNFSSGDLQDLGPDTWEEIDVRRWYMGFKSTLFHHLKLQGQAVINPDWGPVYGSLFDFYATWEVSERLQISAGKFYEKFSKEYEVSSREIVTIERSLLANQLTSARLTGAWVNGVAGGWSYELGVYGADFQEEFTELQGGANILGKLGYDLAVATGLEKAAVGFHWMYNSKPGDAGTKSYRHNFALTGEMKQDRWAAIADVLCATGENVLTGAPVPDVWGVSLIPSYDITEKLQVVARYQFASSSDDNGLSLQNRYERTAPDLVDTNYKGDQYQACYLGLNYYLCGQKLKLMTGVEHAAMRDNADDGGGYDGWTWMSGLRLYF
jgi:phosphate-selective porin OprO/OprP